MQQTHGDRDLEYNDAKYMESLTARISYLEKEISDLAVLESKRKECDPPCYDANVSSPYHNPRTKASSYRTVNVSKFHSASPHNRSTPKNKSDTPVNIIVEGQRKRANVLEHIYQERHNGEISQKNSFHPDGPGRALELKRKLNEEMEKSEEAYKIIEGLKEELNFSKARMSTMAKDLQIMIDALNSLRSKYKNVKSFRKEAIAQIDQLKTMNSDLCKKLENEMKKHIETCKINDNNSSLKDAKLQEEKSQIIAQSKEKYEKLQEAHNKLQKASEELNAKFIEAANEIEGLKYKLHSHAIDLQRKNQETEHLKLVLEQEKNKNLILHDAVKRLEEKLIQMQAREMRSKEEIKDLRMNVEVLEETKRKNNQKHFQRQQDYDRVKNECVELKRKFEEFNCKDVAKCIQLEKEVQKLQRSMQDKEKKILAEKDVLSNLVGELSEVVRSHKLRIKELMFLNKQQDAMLQNQTIILQNKEQQIKMVEDAMQQSRMKTYNLEQQVDTLRYSLTNIEKRPKENGLQCDCKAKLFGLQDELQQTRQVLENEKEKLLIKEKIIDDQADTIKKLKDNIGLKGDELKTHNSEIYKLQRLLQEEQKNKQQLQQNIRDIEWHKNQLKEQIENLEQELHKKNNIPKKTQAQLEQQQRLLNTLEKKVAVNDKEWEIKCQVLTTEKQRAVKAAKFATQKLVDTVNEFQEQAENQKQVQSMLTNLVETKNERIKSACKKIVEFKDFIQQRDTFSIETMKSSKKKNIR